MKKLMSVYGEGYCQIHLVREDGNHEDGFSLMEFVGDGVYQLYKYSGVDSTGGIHVNTDGYVITENEP